MNEKRNKCAKYINLHNIRKGFKGISKNVFVMIQFEGTL